MPPASQFKKPAYHIWFLGPESSGKTTAALSFPRICTAEFDATGMDVIYDPSSRAYQFGENLVYRIPLIGIEPRTLFTYTDKPNENSIYGAVAKAIELKQENKIDTFFLDGYTYMATEKWNHIFNDEDERITTKGGALDTQKMYGKLSAWLSQFTLGTLAPLASQYGLNVIVTCHVQRESKNTIEGFDENDRAKAEVARATKRLVNLDSDMAPQIVGGFRQQIGGIPSAMIYLDHWMDQRPKTVKGPQGGTQQVKDASGAVIMEEFEYHIAYCRQCRVERWDTVVKAKNRYGLPSAMNITDKSFYRLLLGKLKEAQDKAAQDKADAEKAKAEAAKVEAAKASASSVPVAGATPPAPPAEPVATTTTTTTKTTKPIKDDKENTK